MSYQLMEQMDNWEEDMDKLSIIIPIVGCAFKKTYYSGIKGQNVSELVLAQDLIVDYYAKSLEDATRITHRLSLTTRDIKERQLAGIYSDGTLHTPGHSNLTKISDEIDGLAEQEPDEATPFTVLEQHRFWDLDGDGYEEPYIVTVEEESHKVLRIVARFDAKGITRSEVEEGEEGQGEIIFIQPVHYFTKFPFIPNPDGGFYDVGFGTLLGSINSTIDTAINQLLDAGTLSNMPSGFLGRGIRLKAGNARFSPGEWKFVNTPGEDLRKGIVPLPINSPDSTVFQLLGLMIDAGQRLSSTVDMQVGENPGQNQKATTTMAVLEQGMKVFNSIYKRLYRSVKCYASTC
jgi:chaperonin GroES